MLQYGRRRGSLVMKRWVFLVVCTLFLGACGAEEKAATQQPDEILNEKTISYELAGDTVTEADEVPTKEKTALIDAFNEYINAFNAADLERYMATISKNPEGFDYEEDRQAAAEVFASYKVVREAQDITVIEYDGHTAQVFANLIIDMEDNASGTELSSSGRQVTVFANEEDGWKVTSVYFIGNEAQQVGDAQ